MNKSQLLREIGWSEDLIKAHSDGIETDDSDAPLFEVDTTIAGTTEVLLHIEAPVLISGKSIAFEA